jgi:hypothetical protein
MAQPSQGSGAVGVAPQGALAAPPPQPGALAGADPNAYPQAQNIETLMQTPESAFQAYQRAHQFGTYLDMVRARLGGGEAGAEQERQTLAARQMQPLALAQAKAQFAGMKALYAQLPPDQRGAFIMDPKGYTDQFIKNQQLTKLGQGDVLANASAPGGLAPPIPSVTPYSQGANGILNTATGAFNGVSQPVTVPPGSTAVPFTPSLNGQFGGVQTAPAATPTVPTAPAGAPLNLSRTLAAPAQSYANQILTRPSIASMSPEDQQTLLGIGYSESRLNPGVGNNGGQSTGPFQMQPRTFAAMGGTNINDPMQQADAAAKYMGVNRAALSAPTGLGRDPTPSELYLAQMQGATGSRALITAPAGMNSVGALVKAGVGGQTALESIAGNIGMPYKTAAQRAAANAAALKMPASDFVNLWDKRFQKNMAAVSDGGAAQPGSATMSVSGQPVPAPPPAPTGQGFGAPIVQGKVAQDIPPSQAIAEGLAPGRWQIQPDGTKKQISVPPKGDMDRLTSLQDTTAGLQNLVREQQQFSARNAKTGTAPIVYDNPEVHGIGMNPYADIAEAANPDIKSMAASEAQQLFMVKPANVGARILQSELPFWQRQTQSIGNTGDVNYGILQRNQRELALAQQQSDFYQKYVYEHGNLNGADAAWSHIEGRSSAPRAQSAPAAHNGNSDPLGIR